MGCVPRRVVVLGKAHTATLNWTDPRHTKDDSRHQINLHTDPNET